MCASNGASAPCMTLSPRRSSVASPIICRSALAIEAHRGVASLANTLGMGCAMRLALRSHGGAPPPPSYPSHHTTAPSPTPHNRRRMNPQLLRQNSGAPPSRYQRVSQGFAPCPDTKRVDFILCSHSYGTAHEPLVSLRRKLLKI